MVAEGASSMAVRNAKAEHTHHGDGAFAAPTRQKNRRSVGSVASNPTRHTHHKKISVSDGVTSITPPLRRTGRRRWATRTGVERMLRRNSRLRRACGSSSWKRDQGGVVERAVMSSLGSSLEYLRYSQEYLNHATFAPPRPRRSPDGVAWLAWRVQTGRRVKLPRPVVRGWYEPCNFEQWMLFEQNSLHTSGTMRRRPRNGRDLAYHRPHSMLDHVNAT